MKMKNKILNLFLGSVALAIGLSSCHDDPKVNPTVSEGNGEVMLSSLSIDASDAEKVVTSTPSRASVSVDNFIVTITESESGKVVKTWIYNEMPEVFTLPVGTYDVLVESHKVAKAEWEKPYYMGTKEFTIENNKITQIGTVKAAFSSLRVSVRFSDELRQIMGNDVTVTVKSNDSGELVFTPEETRSGYFEVVENSTTLIAHFEGTIDGTKTVFDTPFTNVEPGQHHIITYKAKSGPSIPEQSGTLNPSGVVLDANVQIVDIDGNVLAEEDILDSSDRPGKEEKPDDPTPPGPGPDDPSKDNAATFEATESPNLHLDEVNIVSESFGNAIVTIKCEKGIKNLVVTINTDNSNFTSALSDLGLAEPFDLAYPGDLESSLGEDGLGLAIGDQVIDQTEVPFNITQFVPMLNGFPGNHNFILSVTDNEGRQASLTLRFKAN